MNTKVYLSIKENRELIETLGDAAALLFSFYLRKYGTPDYLYQDIDVARSIGWTQRKVQDVRRKLIKGGLFYQATATYPDRRKVTTTYLGKQKVLEYHEGISKAKEAGEEEEDTSKPIYREND